MASVGREAGTELGAEEEAGMEADVEAAAAAEGTDIFLCWDPTGVSSEAGSPLPLHLQVPPSYLELNIRDEETDLC